MLRKVLWCRCLNFGSFCIATGFVFVLVWICFPTGSHIALEFAMCLRTALDANPLPFKHYGDIDHCAQHTAVPKFLFK